MSTCSIDIPQSTRDGFQQGRPSQCPAQAPCPWPLIAPGTWSKVPAYATGVPHHWLPAVQLASAPNFVNLKVVTWDKMQGQLPPPGVAFPAVFGTQRPTAYSCDRLTGNCYCVNGWYDTKPAKCQWTGVDASTGRWAGPKEVTGECTDLCAEGSPDHAQIEHNCMTDVGRGVTGDLDVQGSCPAHVATTGLHAQWNTRHFNDSALDALETSLSNESPAQGRAWCLYELSDVAALNALKDGSQELTAQMARDAWVRRSILYFALDALGRSVYARQGAPSQVSQRFMGLGDMEKLWPVLVQEDLPGLAGIQPDLVADQAQWWRSVGGAVCQLPVFTSPTRLRIPVPLGVLMDFADTLGADMKTQRFATSALLALAEAMSDVVLSLDLLAPYLRDAKQQPTVKRTDGNLKFIFSTDLKNWSNTGEALRSDRPLEDLPPVNDSKRADLFLAAVIYEAEVVTWTQSLAALMIQGQGKPSCSLCQQVFLAPDSVVIPQSCFSDCCTGFTSQRCDPVNACTATHTNGDTSYPSLRPNFDDLLLTPLTTPCDCVFPAVTDGALGTAAQCFSQSCAKVPQALRDELKLSTSACQSECKDIVDGMKQGIVRRLDLNQNLLQQLCGVELQDVSEDWGFSLRGAGATALVLLLVLLMLQSILPAPAMALAMLLSFILVIFMGRNLAGVATCDGQQMQCAPRYWPKGLPLPPSFCTTIYCECNELTTPCPAGFFCADGRCWQETSKTNK